jgi:hypothetical protein
MDRFFHILHIPVASLCEIKALGLSAHSIKGVSYQAVFSAVGVSGYHK